MSAQVQPGERCRLGAGAGNVSGVAMRTVHVVYGPPGAGKSTHARAVADRTGAIVYDADDWPDRSAYARALDALGRDPTACAVVVACGTTHTSRTALQARVRSTAVTTIALPLADCIARIRARARTTPPIDGQIAAARRWWAQHDPHESTTHSRTWL